MAEARYAIMTPGGDVWNICLWDPEKAPDWRPPLANATVRECPEFVGIGMRWDAEQHMWVTPPAPRRGTIPLPEFLDRFTEEETLASISAARTDARLQMWRERLFVQNMVDLDSAATRRGMSLLVTLGVLTTERMSTILA